MQIPSKDEIVIPPEATHLEYSTSRVAIIAPINAVDDFKHMRGRLRFGKYVAASDRFVVMCGDNEPQPDGICVMPNEHRGMKQIKHVLREEPSYAAPAKAGKSGKGKPTPPKAPGKPISQPVVRLVPATGERGTLSAFIDALIMEGGHTVADICDKVVAKFPDRTPQKAKGNIQCRHYTLTKAGKNPPSFAK